MKSVILRDGVESLPFDYTVELGDGEFFWSYPNCSLLPGCSVSKSKFIK